MSGEEIWDPTSKHSWCVYLGESEILQLLLMMWRTCLCESKLQTIHCASAGRLEQNRFPFSPSFIAGAILWHRSPRCCSYFATLPLWQVFIPLDLFTCTLFVPLEHHFSSAGAAPEFGKEDDVAVVKASQCLV